MVMASVLDPPAPRAFARDVLNPKISGCLAYSGDISSIVLLLLGRRGAQLFHLRTLSEASVEMNWLLDLDLPTVHEAVLAALRLAPLC